MTQHSRTQIREQAAWNKRFKHLGKCGYCRDGKRCKKYDALKESWRKLFDQLKDEKRPPI